MNFALDGAEGVFMKNIVPPEIVESFKKEPVSIPKIVKYLDENEEIPTSVLCNLIGVRPQQIYSYRTRQRKKEQVKSTIQRVIPKASSKSHARYSAEDKFMIVESYIKSNDSEKSRILREYGLYSSDIQRWREQIKEVAIEKLGTRKVRKDKKSSEQIKIEELEKELKEQEKVTAKLTALVILQKKTEGIFKEKIKN